MTKIETIESELKKSRTELAFAHKQITERTELANQLTERRGLLTHDAKIRNDKKAQQALDGLTRELFVGQQDSADLRRAADDIEAEIKKLEQNREEAQRELKIEQLRALMADRNRIAVVIEKELAALVKSISAYHRAADDIVLLADALNIPGTTTRGLRGKPMLKDFLATRLKFLFESFPWIEPAQRLPLVQLERDAAASLESSIRQREAA